MVWKHFFQGEELQEVRVQAGDVVEIARDYGVVGEAVGRRERRSRPVLADVQLFGPVAPPRGHDRTLEAAPRTLGLWGPILMYGVIVSHPRRVQEEARRAPCRLEDRAIDEP